MSEERLTFCDRCGYETHSGQEFEFALRGDLRSPDDRRSTIHLHWKDLCFDCLNELWLKVRELYVAEVQRPRDVKHIRRSDR